MPTADEAVSYLLMYPACYIRASEKQSNTLW
jgi:hypothetical protein